VDRGYIFDGTNYTTGLNKPGATHTVPLGINNGDWIVGTDVTSGVRHGFLLVGGNYTTIDYPGKSWNIAYGINDAGKVVGFYSDSGETGPYHGFLYDNGVYTPLDVPGSTSTQIRGINNSGQLSGFYKDAGGLTHGFLATPPAPNPDFNGDGFVDAADYVKWRKDGGTIDDYDLWRSSFGDPASGAAAASSSSVPEPAALTIVGGGMVIAASRFGRRPRR
jgi:probable HAF family extracellular repeat protein